MGVFRSGYAGARQPSTSDTPGATVEQFLENKPIYGFASLLSAPSFTGSVTAKSGAGSQVFTGDVGFGFPGIKFGSTGLTSIVCRGTGNISTNAVVATLADTTGNRPTLTAGDFGAQYYDRTLGKPIWWSGTQWKDAAGTVV